MTEMLNAGEAARLTREANASPPGLEEILRKIRAAATQGKAEIAEVGVDSRIKRYLASMGYVLEQGDEKNDPRDSLVTIIKW